MSAISKASAQQRAGRAGRTRPGKCFRLYTGWCVCSFTPLLKFVEVCVPGRKSASLLNSIILLHSELDSSLLWDVVSCP